MRFKILMALLVLVTTVVAIITIAMANLFHNDKRTYLHDLAGAAAVQTAEEVKSRLIDYQQKVQVFARMCRKQLYLSRVIQRCQMLQPSLYLIEMKIRET